VARFVAVISALDEHYLGASSTAPEWSAASATSLIASVTDASYFDAASAADRTTTYQLQSEHLFLSAAQQVPPQRQHVLTLPLC
jgi:hypothetical protein